MTSHNETEKVLLKTEGRIGILKLNRPKVINAIDLEILEQINEKLDKVAKSDLDVLIIRGEGKGFSAGGDIKFMLTDTNKEEFYGIMDLINQIVVKLYTLPKLVISAVHGPAAGLGFSFALASDYIMAERSAVFAMNFIKIGLIPDGGGHFFLNKRLGEVKAKHLIWEGKVHTSQEALTMGLIDEIVNEDVLLAAKKKAEEWLKMPISAMLKTKKIYTENSKVELIRILEMEKEGQYLMRKTSDHKEGLQAFLEKRNPIFTGK
ncbi:enoyl-CoA hydratase [Vulcanibacillus modesticaldus]|uniref:enoyl-CoA hydratase n=1 Tax=Vulcanibacillus modesticaldus TaxID=337097 RepID=UPI000A02D5BB|nr:enoyl-CoA hydratase [Vulcanibacillus modesticaldus]